MNRLFSAAALLIALLLHAGLIAWVIVGVWTPVDKTPERVSMAVQLLPMQEKPLPEPVALAPSAPLPPPVPSPAKQKPIDAKAPPKPKPKPAAKPRVPRKQATTDSRTPPAPVPSSPDPVQAAPRAAPAATPEAQPAPVAAAPSIPVKTSVSIPAEYAASNPKPVYPSMAKRYGEQGTVMLRVFVKADGTAGQVEITSSSGYPILDESARTTIQRWRFHPATIDGKAVSHWYPLSYTFKLQN